MPADHFRPLLLHQLDVRAGPWRVHRLALHHHHTQTVALRPHRHRYAQVLCYLNGCGRIAIGGHTFTVHSGNVVYIPAREVHSFVRETVRNPLCLVIDFDPMHDTTTTARVVHTDAATLARIRGALADLRALHPDPTSAPGTPATGAAVLTLFALLLSAAGLAAGPRRPAASPALRKVRLAIGENPMHSVQQIAQRTGWNKDHLNRLLRRETGLTIGQLRSEHRLQQARQRLLEHPRIADAALACGFEDPNYFARWFKKQTGLTPREYVAGFPNPNPAAAISPVATGRGRPSRPAGRSAAAGSKKPAQASGSCK